MTRYKLTFKRNPWRAASAAFLFCMAATAQKPAQTTTAGPATDSSVQASPSLATEKAAPRVSADDASAQASPITPVATGHGSGLAANTVIPLTLVHAIDSGTLKNGDMVSARLSARVGRLAAGTPVALTVVATVPAGKLGAAGEMSLQVLRVGTLAVYTDTQTFRGMPGHKDLPDSAPALGTDAGLAMGAPLTFHVLAPPVAASGPPAPGAHSPGSVTGRASGAAPPAGANDSPVAAAASRNQQSVTPANTTSTPIHGAAPNGAATQPK